MARTTYFNPLDVLDEEIPYPAWMEEDLYGEGIRDRYEEEYNEMLMDGGDI